MCDIKPWVCTRLNILFLHHTLKCSENAKSRQTIPLTSLLKTDIMLNVTYKLIKGNILLCQYYYTLEDSVQSRKLRMTERAPQGFPETCFF